MNNVKNLLTGVVVMVSVIVAEAQESKPAFHFYTRKGRGVGMVTADSLFSLNFQFRMQNRAAYVSESEDDLSAKSYEFRVRRLRLKFEGFIYNPRLTYNIQLSLSRGDMDWRGTDDATGNSSPNVVRDAVIYYSPVKNLRLGFGQTKLPGNRQRVVSSGDQQFIDRSIVNATFNIDRDFGFFAQYTAKYFNLRGAITSGDGRNAVSSNNGLAYTGRVEFLPLGRFTGTNDYSEGDLAREPLPKISIACTYSFNDRAVREAGQLGNDLYAPRSIANFEADVLFKHNGWAWYNEYMQRDANNPVTTSGEGATRHIYVGYGYLSQVSRLFKNNVEVAGRYSAITPRASLYNNTDFPAIAERKLEQVELGITKYLTGHRLKIQGNIVRAFYTDLARTGRDNGFWSAIFQMELGI